jgi:hypothetical protein
LMKGQLIAWTLQTDATGKDPCQALVIATFELDDSGPEISDSKISNEPGSVLRIEAHSGRSVFLVSISDPPTLHGWRLFGAHVKWSLARVFRRNRKVE